MNEFKDILAYYRKRNGWTQRELAEKLGVSTSAVGMYESGKRYPEREIEEAIADIFNVSISILRGITQEEQYGYQKHPDEAIVADLIFNKIKNKCCRKLYETLGDITDEECEELIRYAEFIVSKRKDKT